MFTNQQLRFINYSYELGLSGITGHYYNWSKPPWNCRYLQEPSREFRPSSTSTGSAVKSVSKRTVTQTKRLIQCVCGTSKVNCGILASDLAYTHNRTSSRFHNLPMEIILDITESLSPRDRLILQRVCSKFRRGLAPDGVAPDIKNGVLSGEQIYQVRFLLREDIERKLQDEFDRDCENATRDSSLYRFGCCACRTIHEMTYFTVEELQKSPKVQICKAAAASYHVCSHMVFSGQCLLRALRIIGDAEL